jgi:hypothetical protein
MELVDWPWLIARCAAGYVDGSGSIVRCWFATQRTRLVRFCGRQGKVGLHFAVDGDNRAPNNQHRPTGWVINRDVDCLINIFSCNLRLQLLANRDACSLLQAIPRNRVSGHLFLWVLILLCFVSAVVREFIEICRFHQ